MKLKCAQYWPINVGEESEYGNVLVKLISENVRDDHVIRELLLVCTRNFFQVMLLVPQLRYLS